MILAGDDLRSLGGAYPLAPCLMRHSLADHPLLSTAALADAAARLDPALVEHRAATTIDAPFARGGDVWTMLRFLDRLPDYAALIEAVIAEIAPVVTPVTGKPHTLRGFAFVSSPAAITPFHFDPEYNLLFQISGTKTFALYPPTPPALLHGAHAKLHCGGDNILAHDESLAGLGRHFVLRPGDVLYVPYKSPHWVEVGDDSSISLSITWQSAWTDAQRDAHRFAARIGRSAHLPPWPQTPRVRALAGRVIDRLSA